MRKHIEESKKDPAAGEDPGKKEWKEGPAEKPKATEASASEFHS